MSGALGEPADVWRSRVGVPGSAWTDMETPVEGEPISGLGTEAFLAPAAVAAGRL